MAGSAASGGSSEAGGRGDPPRPAAVLRGAPPPRGRRGHGGRPAPVTSAGAAWRGQRARTYPAGDRAVVPAGFAQHPRNGTAGQIEYQKLPATGTQRLGRLCEKDFLVYRVEDLP